jgi:hypothetical protein
VTVIVRRAPASIVSREGRAETNFGDVAMRTPARHSVTNTNAMGAALRTWTS